eukprot:1161102-Pelagomonas_calceolata.AAC.4
MQIQMHCYNMGHARHVQAGCTASSPCTPLIYCNGFRTQMLLWLIVMKLPHVLYRTNISCTSFHHCIKYAGHPPAHPRPAAPRCEKARLPIRCPLHTSCNLLQPAAHNQYTSTPVHPLSAAQAATCCTTAAHKLHTSTPAHPLPAARAAAPCSPLHTSCTHARLPICCPLHKLQPLQPTAYKLQSLAAHCTQAAHKHACPSAARCKICNPMQRGACCI